MAALSALIWACVCAGAVFAVQKWYLPYYREKITDSDEVGNLSHWSERSRQIFDWSAFAVSVVVAAACGFVLKKTGVAIIDMIFIMATLCVFNIVAFTDLEFYRIPNIFVLSLAVLRLIRTAIALFAKNPVADVFRQLLAYVIVGVAILVFLAVASKITHGGIGMGDIKLFSALGFLLGLEAVIYTLLISFFLCALVSGFLLLTKKKGLKDGLPMAPFAWAGFALVAVLGAF